MNSVQESKNELEAAIRYAENAISAAQGTIESMEFRQEMAKKQYAEQTGREEALAKRVQELEYDLTAKTAQAGAWKKEVDALKAENAKLLSEKEASSAPCGCQAYRDLEERVEFYDKQLQEMTQGVYAPTMPVIPKDVAIAIFREGVQHGVEAACTELDEATYIRIEESEYVGDFHVTFERDIDLSEHVDTDWMRGKCGDYDEASVVEALKGLCADKEFECRIHGVDDNNNEQNSTT